jgi:hypothetical protein
MSDLVVLSARFIEIIDQIENPRVQTRPKDAHGSRLEIGIFRSFCRREVVSENATSRSNRTLINCHLMAFSMEQ